MKLPILDQATDLSGKKVFVRTDIDVPFVRGVDKIEGTQKISDSSRLETIWPTLKFLLDQNCEVIVGGHLGRPKSEEEKLGLSTLPIAQWMKEKGFGGSTTEIEKVKLDNFDAFKISSNLFLLENLRFDPREEANDEGFARELASLAQVYVNESFGESYREVASIVGVAKLLPHYAGMRLVKEVEVLSGCLENPKRPLVVAVGGVKADTKLPIIRKMSQFADRVIVGGLLLKELNEKMPGVLYLNLTEDGKDSTVESVGQCQIIFAYAETIIWNGPLGLVEDYTFQSGTRWIIELIARSKAFKVVGGGNTVEFLNKNNLLGKFDFVSVGGGSMLAFLSGEKMPGIEALMSPEF